jgi:hypothetical protein
MPQSKFARMFLPLLMASLTVPVVAQPPLGRLKDKLKPTAGNEAAKSNPDVGSKATTEAPVAKEAEPTEPTIVKPSLRIRARTLSKYYRTPKGPAEEETWSCVPQLEFSLKGPVPSGSQLAVEFSDTAGKPWISFNCDTPELKPGAWQNIQGGDYRDIPDEKGSIATGMFPFKIVLKNELQGGAKTLYSGRAKIGKNLESNGNPKFRNHFAYYVDQDWHLPIGLIYADARDEPKVPRLSVAMWFRGQISASGTVAYLFHDGQEVGSTKTTEQGFNNFVYDVATQQGEGKYEWHEVRFTFTTVGTFNNNTQYYARVMSLAKNPGDYEIKVLRNGKLVRTGSFSVGPDGKIVGEVPLAQNGLSGDKFKLHVVIPLQISGGLDGQIDDSAWRTEAFYGNPLTGFPTK